MNCSLYDFICLSDHCGGIWRCFSTLRFTGICLCTAHLRSHHRISTPGLLQHEDSFLFWPFCHGFAAVLRIPQVTSTHPSLHTMHDSWYEVFGFCQRWSCALLSNVLTLDSCLPEILWFVQMQRCKPKFVPPHFVLFVFQREEAFSWKPFLTTHTYSFFK